MAGIAGTSLAAYAVVMVAQRNILLRAELGGPVGLPVAAYVAATFTLFVLYGAVLRLAALGRLTSPRTRLLAILVPLAANVLFLASTPSFSTDTLSYVAHGSIAVDLGQNPHVTSEAAVVGTKVEPELRERGWGPGHPPSPYGPAWTAAEVGIVASIDGVGRQVLAFKGAAMLAGWATAALIWIALGSQRPERRILGVLAFLWSPLIVVELAGEGHNDGLMTLFVVAAVVLAGGRHAAFVLALVAAVLTKYLPLIFAPLLARAWYGAGDGTTAGGGSRRAVVAAGAAVLATIAFLPWWAGASTFDGVRRAAQPGDTGSTPTILMEALERVFGIHLSGEAVSFAIGVISVVAVLAAARRVTDSSLVEWCAGVATVYLLVLSPDYWPWYAVLPVALLCLRPSAFAISMVIALALGSRLAAPLDVLFDHGAIGRSTFLLATWVLGIGLPLGVIVVTLVVRGRSARRSRGRGICPI
jgi:alpha-1,6-mannosyltransferase